MNKAGIRRLGFGGLAASSLYAVALCASAPADADTVLMVGGADVQAFPGAQNGVYMPAIFGGSLCNKASGNQCLVVPFSGSAGVLTPHNPQPLDASIASAADRLVEQIKQTPGPKIAVGYSAGSSVVEEAAERLSKDPNGPSADELSLITVGSLNDGLEQMVPPGTYLQSIGYTVQPSAPTKYETTVVTDKYDGLANSAPNPLAHPLAALNSMSGAVYSHLAYFNPDINWADPSYLVSQNGNVRHVVLPNQVDMPLTQALRDMGQPQIADALTGPIQSESSSVTQSAAGGTGRAYSLPPHLVDQLISAAAPTFVSLLNEDKDKMFDKLLPVLVAHPELFDNVPLFAPQNAATPPAVNKATQQTNDDGTAPGATSVAPGS